MQRTTRLLASAALAAGLSLSGAVHADAPEPVNNSSLNAGLMYQILIAEMSAFNGDDANAFSLTLDAARRANSAKLYERAVELGLRSRNVDFALEATRAWQRGFPVAREPNRYLLQILIGTNRLQELVEPLQRELQGLTGQERIATINVLPRYFPRVSNKALAATVVEQALAADLATVAFGPAAWSTVGLMRLGAGNLPGALEAAQRGAALSSGADEPAVLALNLMEAKVPVAEAIVRQHLQSATRPEIRMGYGRALISGQRFAEALAQMKLINQHNPTFADAWLVRGSLEIQERSLAGAESSLRKYLGLLPEEQAPNGESETGRGAVQAYLLLAQIAEMDGRTDEANALLQRIQSPQDALRVTTRRATLLARQGKLDEARAVVRSAPELQADDARTKLSTEIQLLRDYKQLNEAYALLTTAVQKYPDDNTFAYDLALIAEKLGRADEMEKLLRALIARAPDYHHAYNALGYSLADRGMRLDEARQLILKALEFAPADPFIVDSLAWLEFRSGNLGEAQRLLQQAYASRQDAEIAAHLGEVLWVSGQREAATTIWRQGLELQKDNETLQETIRRLNPAL